MQVICKQSKVMYAFVGTFLGLFLFLLPYSTIFSPLSNLSVGNTIGSILYTFLLCVLLFCYLPNFRMIFDDSGICKLKIAVKPSLTSLPSRALSFSLTKPLALA